MSDYSVIHDIGSTLLQVLWTGFETDAQINPAIISSSAQFTFDSPADMTPEHRLSLFLFRITENPFMRNREREAFNASEMASPPCVIDLHYLLTPRTQNRANDQLLTGKILQILHDHAVLRGRDLQGSLAGTAAEFRVTFTPLSLETLTEVWNLFRDKSYMLSLCYQVAPLEIESSRTREIHRVQKKDSRYYQILEKRETG